MPGAASSATGVATTSIAISFGKRSLCRRFCIRFVAAFADIPATEFTHALINEYAPGTPLGWHRDAPVYGTVAGVSLAGMGRMRLRPYPPRAGTSARAALVLDLAPRSAYVLEGPARCDWQHAISPTKALRYSVTFRTLVNHG